jgi:hypothetical protein
MLGDVTPHFYGTRTVDDDGDGLSNIRLRVGEVQAVFGPKHALNVSKKRNEYQVHVTHRANRTIVTKLYEHCFLSDMFGSFADFIRFTLRADPSARRNPVKPGVGAKVLILCINGESQNAVILSGIPDAGREADPDPDPDEDGHHLQAVFNGVEFDINKDGELLITYGGATNADATLADGVDQDAVGTFITLRKDGSVLMSDAKGDNSVLMDRPNSKVVVTTGEYDVVADTIRHGSTGASSPHMLGDKWKAWMNNVLEQIQRLTVFTSVGESSPPINLPEFQALAQQLDTLLSQKVFVE